jgi:hypothetical protein
VAASASQNTHVFDKMGWGWWIKICRGEAPYLHHLLVKVEVLDFFVVPPMHHWTRIASFAFPYLPFATFLDLFYERVEFTASMVFIAL